MAGRPLQLTKDVIRQVEDFLPRALYVETVAAHLGIHRYTFSRWLREGGREQRRRDAGKAPDPKLDLHCELSVTVKKALAGAESDYLSVIQAAGAEAWQALAWVLERRFPQRWATNRGELRALAKQIAAIAGGGTGAKPVRDAEAKGQLPAGGDPHL
jgi:hypothetical protein